MANTKVYDTSKIPPLYDLTDDNITENVWKINSQCQNPRIRFVFERLVQHIHDFARETRLSTQEWRAGILFLTEVGKICSDVRQEFILLSDVLGLSLLVDVIDHPKPPQSTAGTVLGPFHTHDAEHVESGSLISHDPKGTPLLVLCTIKDTSGKPVPGVKIDVWETDSEGFYDVQRPGREEPDGRAVLESDADGVFWFKGVCPVSYPIPHDGPVGRLLTILGRHPMRPAHMHFMMEKPGYDHLITALYHRGDRYESSDAVFGVKSSLLYDLHSVTDPAMAKKYDIDQTDGSWKLLTWDFILVTEQETKDLRNKLAMEAVQNLPKHAHATGGAKMTVINGLPVPDVD